MWRHVNRWSDAKLRQEIETVWQSVIAGTISRSEAHEWAVPWIEGNHVEIEDPIVSLGLHYVHGFDLSCEAETPNVHFHSAEGVYLRSAEDIVEDFEHWKGRAALYDSNPEAYFQEMRRLAEDAEPALKVRRLQREAAEGE